jgi:hypothetical protein
MFKIGAEPAKNEETSPEQLLGKEVKKTDHNCH